MTADANNKHIVPLSLTLTLIVSLFLSQSSVKVNGHLTNGHVPNDISNSMSNANTPLFPVNGGFEDQLKQEELSFHEKVSRYRKKENS